MATWSRRLSAAQAKQPGTSRRAGSVALPGSLPAEILADDQAILRALGALAKGRPGFRSHVTVRSGTETAFTELEVEIRHADGNVVFDILSAGAPATVQGSTSPVAEPEAEEPAEPEGPSGDRVIEMLTDALVITSDIVAIFASVGAEALWANDAFATAIPIREADKIWLIELLDEWSKAHFEVNVLPALVQHGRWHGRLVLEPDPDGGEPLPVTASLVAHRDRFGEIEAVTLVARDLRPLHEAEARIQRSMSPLAALVEHGSDIILVVDGDARVLYASPATTRLLGLDDGQLDGTDLFDRLHPDDLAKVENFRLLAEPDEDGIPPSADMRLRADDGSWRIIEVVAADLTDNTVIGGVVLTARDLTDRVEAVQRLADRAYTDPLTLLPNRMRLLDRLGSSLQSTEQSTVVLLFDLDGFKGFNDAHGHAAGDEMLRQVGHRLSDETRPQDLVARLEGNTFAMVMRNVTDIDGALVAADRIKTRLAEPFRIGTEHVATTASVGIAVSHEGQSAEGLLSDADKAVGIAKQSGGDRIEVLTAELRNSAAQRRDLEGVLRRALTAGDGVEVHYQPVFDLETGRIAAAEALLRVHDDEGALLNPASFLEAAEDSGLIGPLGGQVLQLTCQQLAAWGALSDPDVPQELSVNVSPRQLSDPQFAGTVGDAIDGAGIAPEQLSLEITESMMIGDRGIIDDTVAAVRAMGVAIGLDDFGAGQSSLGYLKRFSLDFVKIDRELIGGLGRDEGDTAIVRATIELAHSLGLLVVAVGVEQEEQLEILKLLGADRAQGFFYAPAVPADELADRVRVHTR